MSQIRIGLGKDSHRFLTEGELALENRATKQLIIGGVTFSGHVAFQAHSDGDVLYHAVFNAISSGLGGKSIGATFPDTSAKERGRDSSEYLEAARSEMVKQGFQIENLSIVVECGTPKIDPQVDFIKTNLSKLLGVDTREVGITATTGEGMTPWGQGLGVEVTCTVLLGSKA